MIFYKFVSFYLKMFSCSVASWNIHFCSIFLEVVLMYNQLDIEEQSSLKKLSLPTNACQQNKGKIKRNKQQSLKKTCPPNNLRKYILFLDIFTGIFNSSRFRIHIYLLCSTMEERIRQQKKAQFIPFSRNIESFYQNLFANHSKD